MRRAAAALTGLVLAGMVALVPAMAIAKGGVVGGSGSTYYLSNTFGTQADAVVEFGGRGDEVYVGDWDGDGVDTLAVRRGATFYLRNTVSSGPADWIVTYGRPGDIVLVGDWDGNGTDSFAIRRGAEYHVKNSLTPGAADHVIVYGWASDTILVGDWDGDGDDTLAVRRGREYHVKNSISSGPADHVAAYGKPGDDVLVGDWDGDGEDTFTVRRGNVYYVKNAVAPGEADRTIPYGRVTDVTVVGDWDGDGVDSLGVRRSTGVPEIPVVSAATPPVPAPSVITPAAGVGGAGYVPVPASRGGGKIALAWAYTQVGLPYKWGGTDSRGYDCSGLTLRAFEAAGITLPRTAREQYRATARVPRSQLQPGDLVFYSRTGEIDDIYHVAIYAGRVDGKELRVQARDPEHGVEISPMHEVNRMTYGGRIG